MPEKIGGVLHDEQPKAKTVCLACIGSLKSLEDPRQRASADADAGVAHLDAQFRAATGRRDEYATAGWRVVDRVAYQVTQHAGQQNRVAESHPPGRSDKERDSL